MAGMFGFDFNKSSSQQHSESGLRGTPLGGRFMFNYAGLGNQLTDQAQGYANSDPNSFQGQTGAQLAGTDPTTGLPASMTGYLNTFANKQFANASAGGALKGQVNQQNTPGIVGSSLQNIGQFLTPYVVDWQKYQNGLPEQYKTSRLGMLQSTMGAMAPGIGQQYNGSSLAYGGGAKGEVA